MVQRKDSVDTFGAVVLVLFSALLGLNQVLIKLVNVGMHPVFQAGLRSACAFFPVLLFAYVMRRELNLRDGSLIPGLLAGCFFAAEFGFMFIGLEYTSVARASILFYTMPMWVALAAHVLIPGELLTARRIAGLCVACAGVVIALLYNSEPATDKAFIGDLLCLGASFFWAAIALLVKTTRLSKSSPEMQLLYQLGVSAPLLLLGAFYIGETWRDPTSFVLAIFTFQVLVIVCAGFLTWLWVLSIYPASDMAVFSFLAPVFGVLLGWLILDEALGINVMIALVLVSAGIVLVNSKPSAVVK